MSITGTSCHRRGIASILGTLIFVGIIFTSFIPMMLLMSQADMLYDMRKHELGILDEESRIEDISVYAYVLDDTATEIYVSIENRGKITAKIVKMRINEVEYFPDETISSFEMKTLGPVTVVLQDSTFYNVKVITEKGGIFCSNSDGLLYADDGWYTQSLVICVHINNIKGKYQIIAKKETVEFYRYESFRMEHGDILEEFPVDAPDTYLLTIKKEDGGWIDVSPPYNDFPVEVLWGPKPVTDVYVDGT